MGMVPRHALVSCPSFMPTFPQIHRSIENPKSLNADELKMNESDT